MAQYKGAASEAGRAMHLMKKREKQREQMEQMKQRIAEVRAGPGPLKAGARTSAPTPRDPARPWAAGLSAGGGWGGNVARRSPTRGGSGPATVCSSVKWAQKAESS